MNLKKRKKNNFPSQFRKCKQSYKSLDQRYSNNLSNELFLTSNRFSKTKAFSPLSPKTLWQKQPKSSNSSRKRKRDQWSTKKTSSLFWNQTPFSDWAVLSGSTQDSVPRLPSLCRTPDSQMRLCILQPIWSFVWMWILGCKDIFMNMTPRFNIWLSILSIWSRLLHLKKKPNL